MMTTHAASASLTMYLDQSQGKNSEDHRMKAVPQRPELKEHP